MGTRKGTKTAQSFLKIRNQKVLLDTNILMLSDQLSKTPNKNISKFCDQNLISICDTVYFESLRNMNHDKFRKRKNEIRKWTENIIPENGKEIHVLFEMLSLVYLFLLKENPNDFLRRNIQDLWIITAALSEGITIIVTRDNSLDFHHALFTSDKYHIGNGVYVDVKRLNVEKFADIWNQIKNEGVINVSISQGYIKDMQKRAGIE